MKTVQRKFVCAVSNVTNEPTALPVEVAASHEGFNTGNPLQMSASLKLLGMIGASRTIVSPCEQISCEKLCVKS